MVIKHCNCVSLFKTLLELLNKDDKPLDSLEEIEKYEIQQVCDVVNSFRRWFSGEINQIRQQIEDDDDVQKFINSFRQFV